MHSLDALPEFFLLDVAAQCSLASLDALLSTCRRLAALRWFGELRAWPQARWVGKQLRKWPHKGEWPAVAKDLRSAHAQWQQLVLRKQAAAQLADLLLNHDWEAQIGSDAVIDISFGWVEDALADEACRVLPLPIAERALQAALPDGVAFQYHCLRFMGSAARPHNKEFGWALDLELKVQSAASVWPASEHRGADWHVFIGDADLEYDSLNERGFRVPCRVFGTRAQVRKWLIYAFAEQAFLLPLDGAELQHHLTLREFETLRQIGHSSVLRWPYTVFGRRYGNFHWGF
jgi:hypothetical protein